MLLGVFFLRRSPAGGELVAEGGLFPALTLRPSRCKAADSGGDSRVAAWLLSGDRPEIFVEVAPDEVKIWNYTRHADDPDAERRWKGLDMTLRSEGSKASSALPGVQRCPRLRSTIERNHPWYYRGPLRGLFESRSLRARVDLTHVRALDVEIDCQTPQLGRIHGHVWSKGCR